MVSGFGIVQTVRRKYRKMARLKIGDRVYRPWLCPDITGKVVDIYSSIADVLWEIGGMISYCVDDLELLESPKREVYSEKNNCLHHNKRKSFAGISQGAEEFWYCPDCKREV